MSALDLSVVWILPSLATLFLLVFLRTGWPGRWPASLWRRGWLPVFLVTRLLYAVLLFAVLDYWTASDAFAWKAHSTDVLNGLVPGRDFENLYGHLYYYLLAAARWLTPGTHWVGTLFPLMLGDLLTVWCGARLGRRMLGEGGGRWIGAYLLLSPYLWHQLVVRGQDESLFLGMLVAAVWLVASARPLAGSLVLAAAVCVNKLTIAPFALTVLAAIFLNRPRDLRPLALFGSVVLLVYGAFWIVGAPPLPFENLSAHTKNYGVGLSIPDAIARILPSLPEAASLSFYALTTLAVAVGTPLLLRSHPLPERMVASLAAVHCASMLTMPYCVSPYLAQGLAFVLLFLASLPEDLPLRTPALACLTVLGGFCALHWTKVRVFSIPLKPLSILFALMILWLIWKSRRPAAPVRG